jgi:hypothetical protein
METVQKVLEYTLAEKAKDRNIEIVVSNIDVNNPFEENLSL